MHNEAERSGGDGSGKVKCCTNFKTGPIIVHCKCSKPGCPGCAEEPSGPGIGLVGRVPKDATILPGAPVYLDTNDGGWLARFIRWLFEVKS
ncbi:hypothetical protein HYH02_007135 [Chlamydomonas schloesseri]|uniref:Uncharacterized protein n=1 Tax=Chlamydomonas schloesseri TaxID=2026947 RepID=A0A835WJ92_9CHLO|nr:hypothetical protein HYH02_007135 [Chlamydomonas schloesseri]|eukprot:KAG2448111.1 hypothetical protein HYH02_007135 [Chlamydomonas schloesseri]